MQYIWQQPNWTSWQIALSNFLTVDSLCHEEKRCINLAKHGLDFFRCRYGTGKPITIRSRFNAEW